MNFLSMRAAAATKDAATDTIDLSDSRAGDAQPCGEEPEMVEHEMGSMASLESVPDDSQDRTATSEGISNHRTSGDDKEGDGSGSSDGSSAALEASPSDQNPCCAVLVEIIHELVASSGEKNDELSALDKEMDGLLRQIQSQAKQIDWLNSVNHTSQKDSAALRAELYRAAASHAELENMLEASHCGAASLLSAQERLTAQIPALEAALKAKDEEIKRLRAQNGELQGQDAAFEEGQKEAIASLCERAAGLQLDYASMCDRVVAMERSEHALRQQVDSLCHQNRKLKVSMAQTTAELEGKELQFQLAHARAEELANALQEARSAAAAVVRAADAPSPTLGPQALHHYKEHLCDRLRAISKAGKACMLNNDASECEKEGFRRDLTQELEITINQAMSGTGDSVLSQIYNLASLLRHELSGSKSTTRQDLMIPGTML